MSGIGRQQASRSDPLAGRYESVSGRDPERDAHTMTDISLLRLRRPAPAGAVFADWSAHVPEPGTTLASVHRAPGLSQAVAFGNVTATVALRRGAALRGRGRGRRVALPAGEVATRRHRRRQQWRRTLPVFRCAPRGRALPRLRRLRRQTKAGSFRALRPHLSCPRTAPVARLALRSATMA